jgi:UDP-N-acetylmuramoyl-tripeptide--D-alanyl-D-alanine ligase
MGELGEQEEELHRDVGRKAAESGVDMIVAVGRLAAAYIEGAAEVDSDRRDIHFSDRAGAVAGAGAALRPGDVVLVKGSRFMGLEELVAALMAAGPGHAGGQGEGD